MLPNKGKSGEHTWCNIKCEVVYTGTKHGVKDKTKKEHKHGLKHSVMCPVDAYSHT